MIKDLIRRIFGFKECRTCWHYHHCDRKPYINQFKDCNYWIINGFKGGER